MLPEVAAQIRGHLQAIESLISGAPKDAEFPDIEPTKLYTLGELIKIRPCSRQTLNEAVNRYLASKGGTGLKPTETGGKRMVRGSDFIAWVRSKRRVG